MRSRGPKGTACVRGRGGGVLRWDRGTWTSLALRELLQGFTEDQLHADGKVQQELEAHEPSAQEILNDALRG